MNPRRPRFTFLFASGILFPCLLSATPPETSSNELRPSDPIVCTGNQDVTIRNRLISTNEIAVQASGNCDVEIINSRLEAGKIGVWARGNADVVISDSYVAGERGALVAENRAEIFFDHSEIVGGTRAHNVAEIHDEGDNAIAGSVATSASASVSTNTRITTATETVAINGDDVLVEGLGETVRITSDGITVDDGTTVSIEPGGVRVTSGDEEVLVEDDYIRVEDSSGVTEISDDWRSSGSTYTEGDTERILIDLGATVEEGVMQLQMAGDVLFDFNSAVLRPEAADQLRKVAHLIRNRSAGRVQIVGHTDSIGAASYNLELSRNRARTVLGWLDLNEEIPSEVMVAQGLGESKPIAHNTLPDGSDDSVGRARNRRVEISFQAPTK